MRSDQPAEFPTCGRESLASTSWRSTVPFAAPRAASLPSVRRVCADSRGIAQWDREIVYNTASPREHRQHPLWRLLGRKMLLVIGRYVVETYTNFSRKLSGRRAWCRRHFRPTEEYWKRSPGGIWSNADSSRLRWLCSSPDSAYRGSWRDVRRRNVSLKIRIVLKSEAGLKFAEITVADQSIHDESIGIQSVEHGEDCHAMICCVNDDFEHPAKLL